ncbi:MAG: type IV toxin-antitoxin system AbiEi family antitoxin domain-containing protein [Ignavibacteriales bacterium]|nr:type IV toxin-antitoxin system AbiEi family antitoxin domain-containing protein [Ignavibacteriales bacterium]
MFGNDTRKYLNDTEIKNVKIKVSTPEMAAMETLHLIPKEQSFDEALKIMEGLTTSEAAARSEVYFEECNSAKVETIVFVYGGEMSAFVV